MKAKFFILGKYDDMKDRIIEFFGIQFQSKTKEEIAASSNGRYIIQEFNGDEFLLIKLSEMEARIDFSDDIILESLKELEKSLGIFPIVEIELTS